MTIILMRITNQRYLITSVNQAIFIFCILLISFFSHVICCWTRIFISLLPFSRQICWLARVNYSRWFLVDLWLFSGRFYFILIVIFVYIENGLFFLEILSLGFFDIRFYALTCFRWTLIIFWWLSLLFLRNNLASINFENNLDKKINTLALVKYSSNF